MARLDFNSDGVEDPQSFDVLPDGTQVVCVIEESDMVETKKQDGSYLKLTFCAIDGEHKGRKFWENLNLVTQRDDEKAKKMIAIATSKLAQLCRACGKVAVNDSEELHGIPVLLTLGVEPAKGDWPAKNTIKKFSRVDDAAAPAEKPAPKANSNKTKTAAPWER